MRVRIWVSPNLNPNPNPNQTCDKARYIELGVGRNESDPNSSDCLYPNQNKKCKKKCRNGCIDDCKEIPECGKTLHLHLNPN